ncbi:MAG TPA: sugar ABC transporter substrate-binding protein, partial [Roseiflexaceae bacterium]|nr:sugar ABC transporter substrate-binding protein [Roseiflexaceae bacterium]
MNQTRRIGMRIGSADPYWVQLREAVTHGAQQAGAELVELDLNYTAAITSEAQGQLTDQILALDLDVVICAYLPAALVEQLLSHGVPVIQLTETDSNLHHPRFCSMNSYYAIASMAATFIADSLAGRGHVIAVGGLMAAHGEDGRSRLRGLRDTLRAYPEIVCDHVPSVWRYDHAFPQLEAALRRFHQPADVLFGFSDSVALAARDAAERLGLLGAQTRVVGINGDPLALAAIVEGRMHATVETPIAAMATEVIALAERAARGEDLPDHFSFEAQLVTQANIAQVAAQKLIAMADLPSRLVGVNRQREQKRLS